MKKIILMAVVAMMSIAANAQVWVGGNFGFNSTTNTTKYDNVSFDETYDNFEFAPEIGYNLDENWAVAVKFGYAHSAESTYEFSGNKVSGRTNGYVINPYVRYTFLKSGNFSAFVDGGVSYATIHVNGTSDKMDNISQIGIGFNPGVAYSVSDKVTLVAHIGELSYNSMSTKIKKPTEVKLSSNAFNLGLSNSISFGAYYAF